MPWWRLHRFTDLQPDIEIEIEASSQLADVARYEADLAVRFVAEGGSYPNAEVISDAPIFPYAAPALIPEPGTDLADLRRKAEAGALTYISTEAVRIGAHGSAVTAYRRALAADPAKAPLITAKYLGAYIGL